MLRRLGFQLGVLAAALGATACLPKDTRPPPALVHMTATPSAATKAGSFDTGDGWTITLDQVLLVLEVMNATLHKETFGSTEIGPVTIPSIGVEAGF